MTTPHKENIIEQALKLTNEDRVSVYGHPFTDFSRVAELTKPILESDIDPRLKHALYMCQVKIARLLQSPDHEDSIVDLAGYANTYAMVLTKLKEGEESERGINK